MENKEKRQQRNSEWNKNNYVKRKQLNSRRKKRTDLSNWETYQAYKTESRWGPIYPCISCHRNLFERSVCKAKMKELQKFKAFFESVDMYALPKLWIKGFHWICRTCNRNYKSCRFSNCNCR